MKQLKRDEYTCDRNRNQICLCGSGLKFKFCCWEEQNTIPDDKVSSVRLASMMKDARYMLKQTKKEHVCQ